MRTFNTAIAIIVVTGCSSYSATIVNQDAGTLGGNGAGTSSTGGGPPTGGTSSASSGGASSAGGAQTVGGTQSTSASTIGGAPAAGGGAGSGGALATSATGGTAIATSSAGAVNTGGTSAGIGGVSSAGGANPGTGGLASSGGVPTVGGASTVLGGAGASVGGASTAPGGSAGLGGTSATTGGANACSKDADCVNPDPVNCSYTCVNPGAAGTCKATVLTTLTRCATDDCSERAISGFWSADGKPYIAYGFTESDGSGSIRMQQVKADGSPLGESTRYALSTKLFEPTILSAAARGEKIGFLWKGTYDVTEGADLVEIYFASTDIQGTSAPSNRLASSSTGLGVEAMWLRTTPTGAWLAVWAGTSGGPVAYWSATSGSTIASWTDLDQNPVQYQLEGGLVGDTLMLTGASCASISSTCVQKFVLQRYSTVGLTAIGPQITLSQSTRSTSSPVMGSVQGRMAVLWTEEESPGLVFSALINEDGTLARAITSAQSAIQPKAIVESSGGGALLIGTVTVGNPVKYHLVAQRLDANLGVIRNPVPLANSEESDADNLETNISGDGAQVLVTYRQAGARYRLLNTNGCD
jgi:hypothetical protein